MCVYFVGLFTLNKIKVYGRHEQTRRKRHGLVNRFSFLNRTHLGRSDFQVEGKTNDGRQTVLRTNARDFYVRRFVLGPGPEGGKKPRTPRYETYERDILKTLRPRSNRPE